METINHNNQPEMILNYTHYENLIDYPEKIADRLNEYKEHCSEVKVISQLSTMDVANQVKLFLIIELTFKNQMRFNQHMEKKGVVKPKISIS